MSAYKFVGTTCAARSPECQRLIDAIKAEAVAVINSDAPHLPHVAALRRDVLQALSGMRP